MSPNVIYVMATILRERIFLQGQRNHLLKWWHWCPCALKRQYMSCFRLTPQFDILISLVLSSFLSEWQDMCLCRVCFSVPRAKSCPKRQHKETVGNVIMETWPSMTWGTGKCARHTYKRVLTAVISLISSVTDLQWRFCSCNFLTTAPGKTGKISTPGRSFQSAFLHVYTHLNDPSLADNCYRKNVIVILCKYIQ